MKTFNGQRLKQGRIYRGLTIEALAEKIGVTKQAISQYENGSSRPEYDKIMQLTGALSFPNDYFLQSDSKKLKVHSTYFRSLMKTKKKYRQEQICKTEHIARIYFFLKEYVEFPALNLPKPAEYNSPADAAMALREYWKIGQSPIANIIPLVEENGCIVTSFATPTDDIDAFSQFVECEGERVYIIALSKNKSSASRIHFDVAHELGHIILHTWSDDIELLSREQFKQQEKEANEFANAFLLPERAYREEATRYSNDINRYVHLKKKWKTSIGAMLYRSRDLGLISQNEYRNIIINMQKSGMKKCEPLDNILHTLESSLLKDAIETLLVNNVFTVSELLEQLASDGLALFSEEIETLLDLPSGTLDIPTSRKNLIKLPVTQKM